LAAGANWLITGSTVEQSASTERSPGAVVESPASAASLEE
jgi:hypothetical protein